jgi:hypothetical protein
MSETETQRPAATENVAGFNQLPDTIKTALQLRAYQRTTIEAIAKTNWGKNMDAYTARNIAAWALQYGIDAATEIEVLGGNIYLNAKFYLRGLAHMIAAGRVEYIILEHIEADPRLADFPEEAKKRQWARIENQVPEAAVSAVVAHIKLKGVPVEFVGCKWAGGRGKRQTQNGEKFKDPIGEEFPVETSETRAIRRAMRMMISHVPDEARRHEEIADSAELELGNVIRDAQARAKVDMQRAARPHKEIHHGGYDEPRKELAAGEVEVAAPAAATIAPNVEQAAPYDEDVSTGAAK